MCPRCQINRAAWAYPRVAFCYDCLPGGPFIPPPCSKCGTTTDYFSQGLCASCHPGSPQHPGSCKGCLAWGVYRRYNWTCWPCRWWNSHYPEGVCDFCGRTARIGERRACRLCLEQARMVQMPGHGLDLAGANKDGHQLFFANMSFHRRGAPPLSPDQRAPWKLRDKHNLPGAGPAADLGVQMTLFDMAPDPKVVAARVRREDNDLTRYCAAIVREHATRAGWSKRQRNDVTRSLRILQGLRPTPTAKVRATDVLQLRQYSGNVISTIDVLAAAGLLIEDRPTRVERYFAAKTSTLPPVMKDQLEVWLEVLTNGAHQPPRQIPRDPKTIIAHILGIEPIIHAWAEAGFQSFAEVTRADITAALNETKARRHIAGNGLKSLFTTLKGRRLIFANPTRGMKASPKATNTPLALDAAVIRGELNSPNPVVALAVALVAFHALTSQQVRELKLTDIRDGHLVLADRYIPLAGPVRTRLAAWLDHRNRTWPGTANAHLLINRRTAPRLLPVSSQFPWSGLTLRPRVLREDRILHEIHATGGDVRRVCDLFGLSVEGATRYLNTLEHPDLTLEGEWVPRT
ncbi:hypothetical protein D7Z96_15150 [Pseudarthrobacter phenanthrenivorans]|uniref:Uncharacterized protein n=2 Tax=Pseudarthrobacter phenanthrenivorans TaxID=361575 RepID=A0A3B0FPH4_PSEPS|nr:hypothetical protein D7Z96_15150 [Pseudarthrobacter phenanthrenivorans]